MSIWAYFVQYEEKSICGTGYKELVICQISCFLQLQAAFSFALTPTASCGYSLWRNDQEGVGSTYRPRMCLGRERVITSLSQWDFLKKSFGFFVIILFDRSHIYMLKNNGDHSYTCCWAFALQQK